VRRLLAEDCLRELDLGEREKMRVSLSVAAKSIAVVLLSQQV
jgi:hypothetical protein